MPALISLGRIFIPFSVDRIQVEYPMGYAIFLTVRIFGIRIATIQVKA